MVVIHMTFPDGGAGRGECRVLRALKVQLFHIKVQFNVMGRGGSDLTGCGRDTMSVL